MKNHAEMFEALLAGEVLTGDECEIFFNEYSELQVRFSSGVVRALRNTRVSLHYPDHWVIKPKTICINGHIITAPTRSVPAKGTTVFVINLLTNLVDECDFKAYSTVWVNSEEQIRMLKLGLIHLTAEAAYSHAKALLSFTAD